MRILGASLALVLIDQVTKLYIKSTFALGESIPILGDFLRITFVENPGMAFGMRFAGRWFLTLFSFIASAVIVILLYKLRTEPLRLRLPLALVLGGAIGNLIDRFLFGKVVDFIEVSVGSFHWPVFNVADIGVSVGMVVMVVLVIFDKDEHQEDTSVVKMSAPNPADSEERDIWKDQ